MKYFMYAICLAFLLNTIGCDEHTSSNRELSAKQENLMQEANRQVGMPAIKHFTERKMAKEIFELRDDPKIICYAYIVIEMTGQLKFLGKCIGYGLPYSTQYTNPDVVDHYGETSGGNVTLPQADPNGLFMPASAEGTWIRLIDSTTSEASLVYCEPKVLISPFPLK